MDILLIFVIFIAYLIIFLRKSLFNYITNLDNKGTLKETNNIYNNYYINSNTKNDRNLINNVAFLRKGLLSNIYDADLKFLEIKNLTSGDNILIFNNNDCNFEIFLAQNFLELKKDIKIIIAKTNILEVEKCENLVNKSGFKNIEIKYINDIDNINTLLTNTKFKRIILRENIGNLQNFDNILINLKKLLESDGFIYVKTLVFRPIKKDSFMVKKQFDIIDFWNYNFSTSQDIINHFKKNGFEVNYKDVNVLLLLVFYNPQDIINIIKLYFVDLNLKVTDIINWLGVYTLNLLHLKAYGK